MKTKFKVGKRYTEKGGMWDVSWKLEDRRETVSKNGKTVITLTFVPPASEANAYRTQFGNLRVRVRETEKGEACNGKFYGTIIA